MINSDVSKQHKMGVAFNISIMCFSTSQITYEERKGAEIDYLKRFGTEWKKEGGNSDKDKSNPSETFICNHPRFQGQKQ